MNQHVLIRLFMWANRASLSLNQWGLRQVSLLEGDVSRNDSKPMGPDRIDFQEKLI